MNIFYEIIGWVGMAIVVCAYLLVSHGKMKGSDRNYHYLNIIAAIAIGIHVYHKQSWPSFVLQIVWIVITLSALISARKKPIRFNRTLFRRRAIAAPRIKK